MTPIAEKQAGSIGELVEAVKSIASGWRIAVTDPQELWFRGQPQRAFPLLPGLYRPNVVKYHYDEPSLLGHFRTLGTPFASSRPADDWEWSFLAQHYGLPTRLLDWTQSLMAAAYFAICEAVFCTDRLSLDDALGRGRLADRLYDSASPTVWVIDAGTLNRFSCGEDIVLYPGGKRTAPYLPDAIKNARLRVAADQIAAENEHPIAILAPRANVRIVAQQGTFTVHGHSAKPLEQLAAECTGQPIQLGCVVLDRANLAFFWEELQLLGMGRLTLFPDLDSVASHVKWMFQSVK